MSEPVVSNAPAQPREGLPPCVSIAFFEGRRVFMRNIRECKHGWGAQGRKEQIVVCADLLSEKGIAPDGYHPDHSMPWGDGSNFLLLWTNDPAEAQAAFARGAEWVRTGEGP